MGWTRNIGLQKSADIADVIEASTWEKIPVKTGGGDLVEHKHNMLNPADRSLVDPVVVTAKAGVDALGGEAFVHVQAQNLIITRHEYGEGGHGDGDTAAVPTDTILSSKAVRVRCIVVTITTETDLVEK